MPYADLEKRRKYNGAYMREWSRKRRADPSYKAKEKELATKRREANPQALQAYRDKHKEQRRVIQAAWRRKNAEKIRAYKAKHWLKHRYLLTARAARRYAANPESYKAARRKRRAILLVASGTHTVQQWMARVEYYGWRCRYCRCSLNRETLSCDHMIPLSKGGSEWASNLVPSCLSCNHRKHAKTFKEFVA